MTYPEHLNTLELVSLISNVLLDPSRSPYRGYVSYFISEVFRVFSPKNLWLPNALNGS